MPLTSPFWFPVLSSQLGRMGLLRWCFVESKVFELAVEGSSTGLRICEKSIGFIWSIYLGRTDSCWLLDTVEELLTVKSSSAFWKCSRAGFPAIIAQRCSNIHGRFLVVEEYGRGKRRGFYLSAKREKRQRLEVVCCRAASGCQILSRFTVAATVNRRLQQRWEGREVLQRCCYLQQRLLQRWVALETHRRLRQS